MSYVIVGGKSKEKLYLTSVRKERGIEWSTDGVGMVIRKLEKVPRKDSGCGSQIVGNYASDIKKAKLFKTREAAEKQIAEYPVLRYCTIEEAVM